AEAGARRRVDEAELGRVEAEPPERVAPAPVSGVTEDGMAPLGQLDADLVAAPRPEREGEARGVLARREAPQVGAGAAGRGGAGGWAELDSRPWTHRLPPITSQAAVDADAPRGEPAADRPPRRVRELGAQALEEGARGGGVFGAHRADRIDHGRLPDKSDGRMGRLADGLACACARRRRRVA